jgi:hypothetical protein
MHAAQAPGRRAAHHPGSRPGPPVAASKTAGVPATLAAFPADPGRRRCCCHPPAGTSARHRPGCPCNSTSRYMAGGTQRSAPGHGRTSDLSIPHPAVHLAQHPGQLELAHLPPRSDSGLVDVLPGRHHQEKKQRLASPVCPGQLDQQRHGADGTEPMIGMLQRSRRHSSFAAPIRQGG